MVPEVFELHYRCDDLSENTQTIVSHLLSRLAGWILATGWQGSVVGLSFAAGTIVCYSFRFL